MRYLAPIAAVLMVVALERLTSGAPPGAASAADWQAAGYGPDGFEAELRVKDAQLALGYERVSNGPDQWLRHESLTRALMARSTLGADYDDLVQATQTIATARRLAPRPAGPHLSEAALALMTHRLDDAQRALARVRDSAVLELEEHAEADALAGDIQFYRGNFAGAEEHYRASEARVGASAVAFRRAILAKASGRFDEAIAQFRAGDPSPARSTPLRRASVALRIGGVEMARGDYSAARRWFETADRQFPGYWLFEAHVAQARALDGDLPGAIGVLFRLAQRTGSAEVIDALALYLREAGRIEESRRWQARAAAEWKRRLEQLPEAAYGHAFEHELAFGTPDRLLVLAERNVRARPYGEARLMMAEALLANRRSAEALEQLRLAESSGWRSAPLYILKAKALAASGRVAEVSAARERAFRLNPRFDDASTVLIRFSHP